MGLQKLPDDVICLRPTLAEDAAANVAVLRQLDQTLLHGDANLAANAARSVAVNQLQQLGLLLMGEGKFAGEALESFADQRQVGLEVDGFDGESRSKKSQIPCAKISGINELQRDG
jgi:hypothetical protein